MARIGVEETLTQVREMLTEMGHEVIELRSEEDARNCDYCIISGQDNNVMGMQDVITDGKVITAQGYNAEEITQIVNNYVNP
jgi:hypothetical protein